MNRTITSGKAFSEQVTEKPSTVISSEAWHRATLITLFVLLLFRLVYLAILPIDLVHDEAYYWDWSRQLDWGYYSKPPGIAWLIGLSTRLFGSNEFAVRLPAALLSTATLYFGFLLAKQMFSSKAGYFAMALAAATPGNAALGTVMTIDAPLLFFWSLALLCFWNLLHSSTSRWRWTIGTACAVGSGLLFKQTMIAFPALCFIFVCLCERHRNELRRLSFWLAGVLSLFFLVPVVLWNYQNEWITLQHTSEHFAAEATPLHKHLVLGLEFLATQFGVVSPVTFVLLVTALALVIRLGKQAEPKEVLLMTFCAIPLLGVVALSFKQRVEPNWPAPFYASGIVLLAGVITHERFKRFDAAALRRALVTGIVITAGTYALPLIISASGLKASKVDAVVRMWGWEDLGEEVGQQHLDTDSLVIVTSGRAMASELAFYLPNQPEVHLWNPRSAVTSQYDLWGMPNEQSGQTALIVGENDKLDARLAARFDSYESVGEVVVPIARGRVHRVKLWRGWNWNSSAIRTASNSTRTQNE